MKLDDLILVKCFPSIKYFNIIDVKKVKDKGSNLEVDLKEKSWSLQYLIDCPMGTFFNKFPYASDKDEGELIGVYKKRKLKKMVSNVMEEMKKY